MAPEPETEALDTFLEYRLASMLLSLVVTMISMTGDGLQNRSEYEPPLENTQSPGRALNALATILVRNAEAVAVTHSDPSPDNPSWDAPNTFEVLVVQEENNPIGTMVPHSGSPIPVQEPEFTIIGPGQSKLAEIIASPWSFAAKPTNVLSLSDHLATVQQYLNESQSRKDQSEVDQYDSFTTYLISTCYPKVRQQLSNSLSTNLLSLLSSITGPQLERYLEAKTPQDRMPTKLGNAQLCMMISAGKDPYDFRAMVRELKDEDYQSQDQSLPGGPDTPKPSTFFEVASQTDELITSGTWEPSKLPILYTEETCVDFHYFLLLALNKYRDAITRFYDHTMDGNPTDKDRQDLRLYSHLLWRLSQSTILRNHLTFLRSLSLIYPQHGHQSKARDGDKEISGAEGMSGDEDVGSDGAWIKEEMAALEADLRHIKDPALMIQRWICLLVSHLQAQHILSTFASSYSSKIRIKHVAMRSNSNFETPQDWTMVLKRALIVRNWRLPARFQEFEDLILGKINAVHEGSGHKGIFRYFKGKNIIGACGQVHCEAGLAAALSSQDTMEQYAACFHGMNRKVLAVSRLCCSLCWELLRVLWIDRFGVHGHHTSVLNPSELPRWIPREAAKRLLRLVQDRLSDEVDLLFGRVDEDSDSDDNTVNCPTQ